MAQAILRGRQWVAEHLEQTYGVNPEQHPQRFALAVKKEERKIAEQFFRWLTEEKGLQICDVQQPSPVNAYQRFVPLDVNHDQLIAEFLGIDYEKLMQEHANSLMSAISRAKGRHASTQHPPPANALAPSTQPEAVPQPASPAAEEEEPEESSWLFPTKKRKGKSKSSLFDFLKIGALPESASFHPLELLPRSK